MNPNLKLILVVIITFVLMFTTSLLLELSIFQHWIRQSIVIMVILVELYLGFVIFKSIYLK